MGYFFESVVDSYGGFLWVKLSIDVPDEECAFADGWPADDDGFIIFESAILYLAHSRNW